VNRIPKLDVEGSNPFARSKPTPQGPEAAKSRLGAPFLGSSPEGFSGPEKAD
jgi:hypothetical protein